jgi:N-glycosylase/DNA lyase
MCNLTNKKEVSIKITPNFDLCETFDCGQCFRWEQQPDGSFSGVAFSKYINISIKNDVLNIKNCDFKEFETLWQNYFDLQRDYDFIREKIKKMHPILKKAAQYAPGIRILNQDPWEALCSFIISQNNNIPRIKAIINRLCQNFGEPIGDSGFYAFPTPERLAEQNEITLAPLRAGFRWKYILDAAKKIYNREVVLEELEKLPLDEARKILMRITGVGPKVAECTLLYGLHKLEAFPIDTWIKKAMQEFFPGENVGFLGEYAGIAQQYLFHYCRMNPFLHGKPSKLL